MPAKYKLTYFDLRGLGEPIRYLLAYTGDDFEDNRFAREDWPKLKPNMPFGKVPVLEFDGKKVAQSKAICRYLAKQSNLAGSNDWENLQIDMIVETVDDIRTAFVQYFHDSDETKKAAKLEVLVKETIPFYLGRFEKQVKENNGYFVNGKLTWCDIYFASQMKFMCDRLGKGESVYGSYPDLVALHDKVHAIPKIASYLAKRPPFQN